MEEETYDSAVETFASGESFPDVIDLPEAIFATFDDDGFPTGFYSTLLHGDEYPVDAVEITKDQWSEFISNSGRRKWVDGEVVEYEPPPPLIVKVVDALDFWSRMLDEEAEAVEIAMKSQPFRVRKIFETAKTFREDHELWPLLVSMAESMFGEDRAKVILSPSRESISVDPEAV